MQLTFQFLDISKSTFFILDFGIVVFVAIANNNMSLVIISWVWLVEQLGAVDDCSVWIVVSDQLFIWSVQWETVVVVEEWSSVVIEQIWPV